MGNYYMVFIIEAKDKARYRLPLFFQHDDYSRAKQIFERISNSIKEVYGLIYNEIIELNDFNFDEYFKMNQTYSSGSNDSIEIKEYVLREDIGFNYDDSLNENLTKFENLILYSQLTNNYSLLNKLKDYKGIISLGQQRTKKFIIKKISNGIYDFEPKVLNINVIMN